MQATESTLRDRIVAHLLEHPEGRTRTQIAAALNVPLSSVRACAWLLLGNVETPRQVEAVAHLRTSARGPAGEVLRVLPGVTVNGPEYRRPEPPRAPRKLGTCQECQRTFEKRHAGQGCCGKPCQLLASRRHGWGRPLIYRTKPKETSE